MRSGSLVFMTGLAVSVALLASTAAAIYDVDAFRWGYQHIGSCLETCCCKVCSSPTGQAYPYGLIDQTDSENPLAPKVIGGSCRVPTWQDRGPVNDTSDNLVTGPDKLFWADFSVFGDSDQRVAPNTCDCCRLSVDTNCAEEAPIARQPTHFVISQGGVATEGTDGVLVFHGGFGLSPLDLAELRNDTHCGYNPPAYTMRTPVGTLIPNDDFTHASWRIDNMPTHGCYRVCYYQQNLTTPGWYHVGDIVIHQQPQTTMTYVLDSHDVLLTGNEVTLTFFGQSLLNVFDDLAELRTGGTCGDGAYTVRTQQAGYEGLGVLTGADWCHPAVVAGITSDRPLRRIAIQYSDCPSANRLFLDRLTWKLVLPAAATYSVCYQLNGTWVGLSQTITVPAQLTAAAALQALYDNTQGNEWPYSAGWGGTDACQFHGVRCDATGNVVSVFLGRNNLQGTLPVDFFRGAYFNTITDLKLDMNTISGTVPHEIGAFRKLRILDISYNALSGVLPTSLLRTDLQTIYVPGNNFDGEMPHELSLLSQQWTADTGLSNEAAPNETVKCPTPAVECSDRGSTTAGVTQCGYTGITEAECLVRGCCFNSQAPLTFGGTACFTKRAVTYDTLPPCSIANGKETCVPQVSTETV